jgi:hypothetical protein
MLKNKFTAMLYVPICNQKRKRKRKIEGKYWFFFLFFGEFLLLGIKRNPMQLIYKGVFLEKRKEKKKSPKLPASFRGMVFFFPPPWSCHI